MKAAVFKGVGLPLAIETLPDPTPGPTDVIVKVSRCGICGTDLHMTSKHEWNTPVGSVIGHEYTGEVVALGSAVERLRVGDRISGMARPSCGRCDACLRGFPLLCELTPRVNGGFAELIQVYEDAAVKLPQTLSIADGALVEPMAIGLHGVRMAEMRMGARVLVLGAGSVGLAVIYWARRLGAHRIVAASRSQGRAAMALAMGADAFVQTGANEIGEVVEALGGAPNIVFECVGAVGMLERAMTHAANFGQVLSLGFCTAPDPVIPSLGCFKQLRIGFPLTYSPGEFEYVANMIDSGHVDPATMVTSVAPLDDLPAVLEALRRPNSETKVQISMDATPC
jgi:(R,R)-butanediol dehydrogenase/meso-butanediol dehydrogenase/diacetyl reductase